MIASWIFRAHWERFQSTCREPLAAQARTLRRILRAAAGTSLGRSHGWLELSRTRDPDELVRRYREGVPIRSYSAMCRDLEEVYSGRWQALCPSAPIFFALTAGSTGEPKRIPVTREFRAEVGRGSLAYYGALEAAHPALRKRRAQFLVGSAEGGHSPGGVPVGFISGFNYQRLPGILRGKFALPYWIFTLEDAEDRAYAAARLLVAQRDVGALCAISPVNLINLREAATRHPERLIADLEHGTLTVSSRSAVPGRHRGRPDPQLAARLRDELARDGAFSNTTLFPQLDVLVCWQGGNMGYHLRELRAAFGARHCFDFPLSASEGLFAIPHRSDTSGGIVALDCHFLEFLPEDAAEASGATALRVDQLQVGKHYRLVVTNSGGLYRYDMEDIVCVTGMFSGTPTIEFVSKKDRQVSVANERVNERDVTATMQAASEATGVWVREFVFVPCSDRRYRVLLDGAEQFSPASGSRLASALECQMRRAAFGYDFEREDALLRPLEVVITAPGELRGYLERRLGGSPLPSGQRKPMHLTNEFDLHLSFTAEHCHAS